MTGLELATAATLETPAPRFVILTTFARPGYLRRALDAGAAGYLLKDAPATDGTVRDYLADAISKVGGRYRIDAARIARAKGWLDPPAVYTAGRCVCARFAATGTSLAAAIRSGRF